MHKSALLIKLNRNFSRRFRWFSNRKQHGIRYGLHSFPTRYLQKIFTEFLLRWVAVNPKMFNNQTFEHIASTFMSVLCHSLFPTRNCSFQFIGVKKVIVRIFLDTAVMINNSTLRFDLIRAKSFFRQQAIAHRIAERVHMAAGFPDLRRHDDGRFEAGDVVALAGHGVPPEFLDVALEFRAERAVIPEAVDAAVNLGGLKHKPAPLASDTIFSMSGFSFGSAIIWVG